MALLRIAAVGRVAGGGGPGGRAGGKGGGHGNGARRTGQAMGHERAPGVRADHWAFLAVTTDTLVGVATPCTWLAPPLTGGGASVEPELPPQALSKDRQRAAASGAARRISGMRVPSRRLSGGVRTSRAFSADRSS